MSKEDYGHFKFLGLTVVQEEKQISMCQDAYIQTIQLMNIEGNDSGRRLNRTESRMFKSIVGQIQWTSKQTRPDLSFAGCVLSTKVKNATVADAKAANKYLKNMQSKSVMVVIADTGDIKTSRLLVYSDSSHANLPKGASQGGFIIFLQGANKLTSPLSWKSHKLKRVVKSPMAAETMAFLEAAEQALLLKAVLVEIHDIETLPIICVTDNKSLYDAATNSTTLEDKRLYVDMCAVREMIEENEIQIRLTTSANQLADCFTKGTASSDRLLQVLSGAEVVNIE